MSYHQYGYQQQQPPPQQQHMAATFYPGGSDDYYLPSMPEVISPAPQRIMPEVPENMQHNIANLEHGVGYQSPMSPQFPSQSSYGSPNSQVGSSYNTFQQSPRETNSSQHYQTSPQASTFSNYDPPTFSPFPALQNPGPHVPPTDERREATLNSARPKVLASNDPEMQLSWAQDALAYVDTAMANEARISAFQPPRPRTPSVEHQIKTDAMNVVNFLADQAHPKAEFMRGMWHEFGKFGYRTDKPEAFHCYTRAAEKGYARAEYRIGMQYENGNDSAKAVEHYFRGVGLGDSASNYRLGMMILTGQHGQSLDYGRGLEYIRYAAESADENAPQGAYVYGMLLARELPQVSVPEGFLPYDINGARENIEKAAFLGFAKAQIKMGTAYELCQLGCDFNPALSLHYNALAARQGEAEAEMAISKWFLCGQEGVFEKNEKLAFEYAQRAAQSELATAEFAMGYFYEVGIHVQTDLEQSRTWYSKAAAHGNKDAAGRIGEIARSKTLSRRDHEKIAVSQIRKQRFSQYGAPPLPPIPQESLSMPDPSSLRLPDSYHSPAPGTPGMPYPDARMTPQMPIPEHRPSSAFGINPNIRPQSAATTGGIRPDPYRQNTGGPMPPRPYSSMDQGPGPRPGPGPGYGRGGMPPRAGTANGYRPGGGPMGPGPAPGPGPMNRPPQSSTPKLDIGYSAPLDNRNNRMPQNGPGPGPGGRPPVNNNMPGTNVRPPRQDSAPRPSGPGTPKPSTPAPSAPASSKPASGAPASKPAAAKPATYPPGKGPKTFDEMGVPKVKDPDCVVM